MITKKLIESSVIIKNFQQKTPAHWIWTDNSTVEACKMGQFRLAFTADAADEVFWLGFADTLYTLWCNGHVLGVGPIAGINEEPWMSMWDLTPYIYSGKNILALQVWTHANRQDCHDMGALEAGVIGWLAAGDTTLPTGPLWRARDATGYTMPAPDGYRHFASDRLIVADLRDEPLDWMEPSFCDDNWKKARTVHPFNHPQREGFCLSPIPPMSCKLLPSPDIIDAGWAEEGDQVTFAVDVAKRMHSQTHRSLLRENIELGYPSSKRGPAKGLPDPMLLSWQSLDFPLICPKPPRGSDFYLTVDVGKQTSGCLLLTIETQEECICDVGYGDHLYEGRVNPTIQQNVADRIILPSGSNSVRLPHDRGCRYVQICFSNKAVVHDIKWEEHVYPHRREERFTSSDHAISSIWNAARATIHQVSLTDYTDNARRERSAFIGTDLMHTWRGGFAACGDLELTRKQLIDALNHAKYLPEGLLPARALGNGTSESLRAFDSHDISFLITVWDYILHSDDRDLAPHLLTACENLLNYHEERNSKGLKPAVGKWRWTGWSLMAAESVVTAHNLLLIKGMRSVAKLYRYLGQGDKADTLLDQEPQLIEAIFNELIDDSRRVLCQGLDKEGRRVPFCSQMDNALALSLGIVPQDDIKHYHSFCAGKSGTWPTNRTGWQGGATGDWARFSPEKMIAACSPTDSFIAIDAIAKLESPQAAIDYIRFNFGAAVDEGDGTFWECWPMVTETTVSTIKDATCYSHGWGAAVAFLILKIGLGVSFTAPGGIKLLWKPQRISVNEMKGKIRTKSGDVSLGWSDNKLHWQLPDGIKVVIETPDGKQNTITGPNEQL